MRRDLRVVRFPDGKKWPFLKLLGDPGLLEAIGKDIASNLTPDTDVIVGPEVGGILIAHHVAVAGGLPYVIARKKVTVDMVEPILQEAVHTTLTSGVQRLVLGSEDCEKLRGRNVAVVDEAITSGSTLRSLRALAERAGARVTSVSVVATQGDVEADVRVLCRLPSIE